jgi:hypothetical protein
LNSDKESPLIFREAPLENEGAGVGGIGVDGGIEEVAGIEEDGCIDVVGGIEEVDGIEEDGCIVEDGCLRH